MPDPVWTYKFVYGAVTLTFGDETASDENAIGSRMAEYDFPGVHGVEVLLLGDAPRACQLTAWLHAANEAALRVLMDAVNAARGHLGTLTLRGAEDSWGNTVIQGAPQFSDRYPPQADGSVGCKVTLVFRQLIPA